MREQLLAAVHTALHEMGVIDVPDAVTMERPARREHGDWSTNAALVCSKILGRNPREIGQELADNLDANRPKHVEALEIAGPGFVNFRLAPTWLYDVLVDVVAAGEDNFGRQDLGGGKRVNIEFVSANPTGPLHAGGGRWGAYGDSLARIMARCGFAPHKEYYINDRGNQTVLFGQSLVARRDGTELPENGYQGAYVTEWAADMPADVDPTTWGLERAISDVRDALASMHVYFDTWSSEKALVESGAMEASFQDLKESGYVFEEAGATWLRTSDFGDVKDRVLIKADGEPTYMLPDIAYHRDKFTRGELVIDILGADHHGYVPRMRAALLALGYEADAYEAIIGQNVKLMKDGAEVKLSKRTGTMIEIAELVDEVGPDVARFAYLLQSIDSTQTLDIDVLKAQAADNPVFYVQYANARIHSIARKAAETGVERADVASADLSLLVDESELALLRKLSEFPEQLALACSDRAPQKVTTWVRELAAEFHSFYGRCKILHTEVSPELQQSRLWLVEATRIGLATGLDLLGVSAPEQM